MSPIHNPCHYAPCSYRPCGSFCLSMRRENIRMSRFHFALGRCRVENLMGRWIVVFGCRRCVPDHFPSCTIHSVTIGNGQGGCSPWDGRCLLTAVLRWWVARCWICIVLSPGNAGDTSPNPGDKQMGSLQTLRNETRSTGRRGAYIARMLTDERFVRVGCQGKG